MHKAKLDLAVLLIFFARPNTLKEVFAKVKEARPSKLFLACDGAREGNTTDVERIEECKKIVSEVDWECEVYTNYATKNQGCGRGPSNAISWAFGYVDKLLILEDDCVADETLFPFMKEMLDRYEKDERVGFISGFNHMKQWDCCPYSYFFTKTAATLGWGTWRRVWEKYDFHADAIKDPYCERLLYREFSSRQVARSRISDWRRATRETREKKVNYWDIQFGLLKYTQSYLCVVPKTNLIYNIGIGAGSTHTENNKETAWKPGRVLFMPTHPLSFPLAHPSFAVCDREYDSAVFKMVFPSKAKRIIKKIGRILKR